MAGVAVVTDSTSSLDPAEAARADVSIIPLQVVIDDISRPESEVLPRDVAGALNRINQDIDMVTLRINYRFGGYGAPVAARY